MELNFGHHFNQPLDDSLLNLLNLRELILGENFNQPIVLPGGIKKLSMCCNLKYIIDFLPSSIEELEFGYNFNLELDDLPSSIKKIKIKIKNRDYDKKLNNLPRGIELLEITSNYKEQIDFKYKNLNIMYLD